MVESALRQVRQLEDLGFYEIKISLKASDINRTLEAYRLLADKVHYPFHAGITEAGTLLRGSIKISRRAGFAHQPGPGRYHQGVADRAALKEKSRWPMKY